MLVKTMQVPPIGTNCYVLADEKEKVCAVIDPGGDAAGILELLKADGLTLEEEAEREGLRAEFRAAIRESLTAHLDNTYMMDEKGNKTKLKKKS